MTRYAEGNCEITGRRPAVRGSRWLLGLALALSLATAQAAEPAEPAASAPAATEANPAPLDPAADAASAPLAAASATAAAAAILPAAEAARRPNMGERAAAQITHAVDLTVDKVKEVMSTLRRPVDSLLQDMGVLLQPLRLPVDNLMNSMEDLSDYLGPGYQIGIATTASPLRPGSREIGFKPRPVLSAHWGPVHVTSSVASLIDKSKGKGEGERILGLSFSLSDAERWSSGLTLRTDNGRPHSDDPLLRGLPTVKPTLRGRMQLRYKLTHEWGASASLGSDLLGMNGGTTVSFDLGYRTNLSPEVRASMGLGLNYGDDQYMKSYYGVPPSAAIPGVREAFEPTASAQSATLGLSLAWQFHPRWRAGVSLGVTQLRGEAARSPITVYPITYNAAVGLVFVSGR